MIKMQKEVFQASFKTLETSLLTFNTRLACILFILSVLWITNGFQQGKLVAELKKHWIFNNQKSPCRLPFIQRSAMRELCYKNNFSIFFLKLTLALSIGFTRSDFK